MIYLYDINKQNTEIFWAWVKWVCICLARFAGFVENRFSFVGCSLVTTVSRHPQCPHDDQIYLALPNTTNIPNMQFTQIYPRHSLVGDLTSEMTVIEYKWRWETITNVVALQGLGFSKTSEESLLGIFIVVLPMFWRVLTKYYSCAKSFWKHLFK